MNDRFGDDLRLPKIEPPKVPLRVFGLFFVIGLALIVVRQSVYTIEPESVGVVLRFGRHIDNTPPGLHGKIPFVDQVTPVPIQRQLTEEFGFRTRKAGVRSEISTSGYGDESNMLTGDLNAAEVQWVVQYRIVDPYQFLFRVRNVRETFRDMSEAVMREIVGDRTVNEVITIGRQEIAVVVLQKLQGLCEQYETGIQVDQVVLQDVTPPQPVQPAFNEVNQAEQERSKLVNEAQSEYNRAVPKARGEAEQTVLEAEGYALDRVNRARGEADRFVSVYEEYRKAPEVTRKRIYLETIADVLPRIGKKIVVDEDLDGVLPLLEVGPSAAAATRMTRDGGGE